MRQIIGHFKLPVISFRIEVASDMTEPLRFYNLVVSGCHRGAVRRRREAIFIRMLQLIDGMV